MYRKFKRYARRYPEQVILLFFNTGVFAWLKATSMSILSHLNLSVGDYIPTFVRVLIGDNMQSLQKLIGNSPFIWLVLSMIMMSILRFVEGLVKLLIFTLVIVVGIYLMMKNQAILEHLKFM
ncbi:hypothetical protein [Streptococcus porcorum]|uniref:Uncharacterized protein n=1 Tax=Streptococcus porcorum TaxID=701526 RepID=A0ABV2JG05_9STRE